MLFQFLGRRDIGLDHHLLDQAVGVQLHARFDARDIAVGIEIRRGAGRIDVQRLALIAPARQAGVRRPQRFQQGLENRSVVSSGWPSMAALAPARS